MANETTITIVGNLTGDPELRNVNGGSVVNFTIASTPRTFNRQAQQWEDGQALFMRCSAWRDLADHCMGTLTKGMRVIAQGRLSQRSYQAQDGSNRSIIEMTVDEIGPSLRYATAQVQRSQGSNVAQSQGFNSQNAAQSQPYGQQQYQQNIRQGYGQSFGQTQTFGQQQPADPWGQDNGEPVF